MTMFAFVRGSHRAHEIAEDKVHTRCGLIFDEVQDITPCAATKFCKECPREDAAFPPEADIPEEVEVKESSRQNEIEQKLAALDSLFPNNPYFWNAALMLAFAEPHRYDFRCDTAIAFINEARRMRKLKG